MISYNLLRSQLFCFEEAAELIVHLPDFALASLKPAVVAMAIEGVEVPMKIIGIGNQKGKLAIHLAAVDAKLFEKIRDALPDDPVVLSVGSTE
jgi:hypothetical protein